MKNDILFFLFQNISVLFKYANCLFLIFSNNRWQYNNVSSIRVNLIYNVCHNLQFFVYKIFSFVWIVISTDMANNQLFRKLDDNVNFMFFHLENNVLYFFFFFFYFCRVLLLSIQLTLNLRQKGELLPSIHFTLKP